MFLKFEKIKNLSLRYKLIVPILTIEVLTFSILAWNTELFLHRGMSEGVSMGAQTAADLLATLYADSIVEGETEVIEGYIQEITEEQDLHYIAIEDTTGRFLAYSAGEHGEADSDEVFEVSAGITHGTVRVGFSPQKSFDLVSPGRRRALLIVSVALVLSVLVIWIMIRAITKPLVRVASMTQKIATGDLGQRIDVHNADEVGRLAGSFNRMAGRLQNSYENLERQVAERTREVTESKRELEALFNGITDMITVQDANFNILVANRSALKSFEAASAEGIIGKKCYELYMGTCPVSETIETGKPAFSEQEMDGRSYHLYSYPMKDAGGELNKIIVFRKDLTKERALQQQLIESTKMASLGELAACIANEVRNPLAGISGCSQVLRRRFEGNQETEELLDMISSDVKRLEEVVRKFIDFARLSKPELRNTRIIEVVERAIDLIEPQAMGQKVELQRDYRDRELSLLIDERQIRQALLNVFINALQAMPDGGRLEVSIQGGSDSVLIKIADTGEGVAPEQIENIFDPFFTTRHQGTGLGLPIAQIIVEDHGGRSVVESSKGKGTIVTIELPFDGMRNRIDTLMRMSV
jgi:nitrogen fixation/metabolism regulation signal transduction histidine kinase